MSADIQQIKKCLTSFDERELSRLFRDILGWDQKHETPHSIRYRDKHYTFRLLAEKKDFKIYLHTCELHIPPLADLKRLDAEMEKQAKEHLTIFLDADHKNQLWLWVNRPSKRFNTTRLNERQRGELLAEQVSNLYVSLEEEEKGDVHLVDILSRVTRGFDVEKVTKKFYDGFQQQHNDFLKHIDNIPIEEVEDRKWYTSVMLNRLMFVYFIQMKGLLDNYDTNGFNGNRRYLQDRLEAIQKTSGSFYRDFLLPLFHQGLNQREHSRELKQVIGEVRYLNGGIFDVHSLEQKYPQIEISNEAFVELFKFFDTFKTWHLDDRPMRNDNEINPDVLGYIFEKYINQKQMGAYYTKEDITGYISKNTIIPAIFEKAAQHYPAAFAAAGPVWSLLQHDPDTYIYEAMAHGVLEDLPPEIEAGVDDVTKREKWNQLAEEQWALSSGETPTETWREVVARRQRYHEIRELMQSGQISAINDLITYNLNITQFAADMIDHCEDAGLLHALYEAIIQITILDPTCGSGAFLFAALHILMPLYQACLARMQTLVEQHERKKLKLAANHLDFFQGVLHQLASGSQHHQHYALLKTIIVNNLYGVDVMEEAIEICKLRLFLNLIAQLETPADLEPLPDIDFNVLAGNTLVGFTSLDEIRRIVTTKLIKVDDTEKTLQLIEQDALEIERDEQSFRNMQTRQRLDIDPTAIMEYKQQLRKKIEQLCEKLDSYLATEYGVHESKYTNMGGATNKLMLNGKRAISLSTGGQSSTKLCIMVALM